MPRVKRGVPAHAKHKRVLNFTKGHRATKHALYRRAHESMLKALTYQYKHRKERKRDMRRLWITRINAGARLVGLTYGQMIHGLDLAGVSVDRKILAELAYNNSEEFNQLVGVARNALATPS